VGLAQSRRLSDAAPWESGKAPCGPQANDPQPNGHEIHRVRWPVLVLVLFCECALAAPLLLAPARPKIVSLPGAQTAPTTPMLVVPTRQNASYPSVSSRPATATSASPSAASSTLCSFPLAGRQYRSNQTRPDQPIEDDLYRATWTDDGRLWQPYLPSPDKRQSFSAAIEIPDGEYSFDGIAARLYLDLARNGKGSQNPAVASYENGRQVSVKTNDGAPAWGLVEGDGGSSAGFQMQLTSTTCR
jgi:hypothetical protein